MVGRRGRFLTLGLMGFTYIYSRIALDPKPDFLYMGIQESLFDALAYSWWMLALYFSDGFLGRMLNGRVAVTRADTSPSGADQVWTIEDKGRWLW